MNSQGVLLTKSTKAADHATGSSLSSARQQFSNTADCSSGQETLSRSGPSQNTNPQHSLHVKSSHILQVC